MDRNIQPRLLGGRESLIGGADVGALFELLEQRVEVAVQPGTRRVTPPCKPNRPALSLTRTSILFTPFAALVVPVSVAQGNNSIGAQWRSEYYGRGLEQYLKLSASSMPW